MDSRLLPKAELHLHIEGTLEPEMVFALARRNGVVVPWGSVEELRGLYSFQDLQSFLDLYYQGMRVLRTRQDFFDLATAYFGRAAADGVRHCEVFFDPQVHLGHGVTLGDIIGGLEDALAAAHEAHGLTGGLILSFLRDLGPAAAAELMDLAAPYAGRLLGVGLDSAEVGHPPAPFAPVYARARALGLHTVAHAGEEGPAAYIWSALDDLGAERVDHGLHCVDDPALVTRLAESRVTLTGCPLSNVRLRAVDSLAAHPLPAMLAAGLAVTVNSDDPAYFGGYVGDNFDALQAEAGLSGGDVVTLCRNSIEGSFAAPERQAELLGELDRAVAEWATPDRATPDRVTSDRVTSDRVTSDRVTPDRVTPDRVTEV
ncbi:MAG: adenosine deaminase [Propionibacteriaceae bacterium]|jgi:adenosine deaminase|nr:adenosine deaminase [Propionibacteriaceae bacterium]